MWLVLQSLLGGQDQGAANHVPPHVVLIFEAFMTLVAVEGPDGRMSLTVSHKVTKCRKPPATNVTWWAVCGIRVLHFAVVTITLTRLEALVALGADCREIVIPNRGKVCHNGLVIRELGETVSTLQLRGSFHSTKVYYTIRLILI